MMGKAGKDSAGNAWYSTGVEWHSTCVEWYSTGVDWYSTGVQWYSTGVQCYSTGVDGSSFETALDVHFIREMDAFAGASILARYHRSAQRCLFLGAERCSWSNVVISL
jgi:hypothetical protein